MQLLETIRDILASDEWAAVLGRARSQELTPLDYIMRLIREDTQ